MWTAPASGNGCTPIYAFLICLTTGWATCSVPLPTAWSHWERMTRCTSGICTSSISQPTGCSASPLSTTHPSIWVWTVPTNLPASLKTIDLCHNFLFLVLPGSLDGPPRPTHFHLHDNWFSTLPFSALDRLMSLSVMTLSYLVSWT